MVWWGWILVGMTLVIALVLILACIGAASVRPNEEELF